MAWAIYKDENFLWGQNEIESREIASLTKMMTAYVCLKIIKDSQLINFDTILEVPEVASGIRGTSARLIQTDCLSVWDLLHGLLLPSGNDAAVCLAYRFGQILKQT